MNKTISNINVHKYHVTLSSNDESKEVFVIALNNLDAVEKAKKNLNLSSVDSVEVECVDDDTSISITESNSTKWEVTLKFQDNSKQTVTVSALNPEQAEKSAQQIIRTNQLNISGESKWDTATIESTEPLKENKTMKVNCVNNNLNREYNNSDILTEVDSEYDVSDMDLSSLDDSPFNIVNNDEELNQVPEYNSQKPLVNMNQYDANAIASLINNLIIDEFEAIDGYNSAIATLSSMNSGEELVAVFKDIANEENKHVGQLQKLLSTVSSDANSIIDGYKEAEKQIKPDLTNLAGTQMFKINDDNSVHPLLSSANQQGSFSMDDSDTCTLCNVDDTF